MKACVWISASAVCALLFAANALAADVTFNGRIGDILQTRIETFPHPEENITCYLDSPKGETLIFVRDEDDERYKPNDPDKFQLQPSGPLSSCAINIVITDAEDEGVWRLHFDTTTGESGGRDYKVVLEDPLPIQGETTTESDRTIQYEDAVFFKAAIGGVIRARINYRDFVDTESCHIATPNGQEYNLDDTDAITTIGVKKYTSPGEVACAVDITVQSEKSVGNWVLFSRDIRFSQPIERRVNITINVEEYVRAIPSEVTITEGSDLYIRLEYPTPESHSCKLIGPYGVTDIPHVTDENHLFTCGFIVPDVQMNYTGTWQIVFGDTITFKAETQVKVNAAWENAITKLEWIRDQRVHVEVGPADAVYCRIAAPEEFVVFESFGRCSIQLARATEQHNGTWTMVVGTPGKVLTEQHTITVNVRNAAPRPQVTTRVESDEPSVLLRCALEGSNVIRSCKFMDPSGRVLMAPQGVGEDRYSFHGVGVSLESNVSKSDCGLRITHPEVGDLGMWRCSVVTYEDQVYHGFLRVVLPWVTTEDGTVAPPREPTLTATHTSISAVEGDPVTMSCSIQSEIQYCYFRASNGTVFSIAPSTQSDVMEYVGAGFDAGECGIRLKNLRDTDTGPWSCHVGFATPDAEEQRATIGVSIQRAMTANQHDYSWGMQVEGFVHDRRELEYCRYVRIDGLGFGSFSARLPDDRYISEDNLSIGYCGLIIDNPTMLERHPWTVVAKIKGQETEVYSSTDHTLEMPTPPTPRPPQVVFVRRSYTWLIFLLLGISLMLMSLSLASKNNRRWVHQRATTLRNSFRKQPIPPPGATNNTAMAA